MRKLSAIRSEMETWTNLSSDITSIEELLILAAEEKDETLIEQLSEDLNLISKTVESLEFELQLSG